MLQMKQQQQGEENQLRLSNKNWRRYLRLPKNKKKMIILRSGSIFSARKLKRLQPLSLQKKKKRRQTTLVWLICMIKLEPWREG
jgi:hypothetical protein